MMNDATTGNRTNNTNNNNANINAPPTVQSSTNNRTRHHIVTLCSPCRTECGYCHGDRLSVLVEDNPYPSPPGEHHHRPCILSIALEQQQEQQQQEEQQHTETTSTIPITKQSTSDAYALHFETISTNAYLTLINNGWRRSGKLLYLPRNWSSCCPAIPIRLETTRFQISKSQQKLISKFQKCLNVGIDSGYFCSDDYDRVHGRGRGREHECTNCTTTAATTTTVPLQDLKRQKQQQSLTTMMTPMVMESSLSSTTAAADPVDPVDPVEKTSTIPVVQPSLLGNVKEIQNRAKQMVMQNDLYLSNHTSTSWMSHLQNTLVHHVQRILLDLEQSTNHNDVHNDNASVNDWDDKMQNIQKRMDKLCSWKFTKVSKPQCEVPGDDDDAAAGGGGAMRAVVNVTLTNTVCPALHGMTGGRMDKMVLVTNLVACLQECLVEGRQGMDHDHEENVRVVNVSFHEPSGHIHVIVRVRVDFHDVCTLHDDDQKNQQASNAGSKRDVIGQFIISSIGTYGKGGIRPTDLSPPYRISVKSIPSDISGGMPHVHRLYCKYQHAIHGDDDPYCTDGSFSSSSSSSNNNGDDDDGDDDHGGGGPCHHDATQRMTKEQLKVLYPEYEKKQINKIYDNYNGFYRFLCSSPLHLDQTSYQNMKQESRHSTSKHVNGSQECSNPFQIKDADVTIPYGSYHHHYLINDKYLFAVGVVDILPQCLSSVYSFYDPELSKTLNLGKLTALYEIEWVKRAMRFRQDLRYYYLGYYIHSCQKMKYKAQFKPSELLCPVRGVWVDFEQAEKRLEHRSPIRHCCNISTPDEEYFAKDSKISLNDSNHDARAKESVVNRVLFDIGAGTYLTLNMVTDEAKDIILPLLKSFVEEVGFEIASECVVKLC